MRKMDLFSRVFSDALVVDIDLSSWDKSATLYVLADHVERVEVDRLALLAVEFVRPESFNVAFRHLGKREQLESLLGTDGHVQWTIDSSRVEKKGTGLSISLWAAGALSPKLDIVCDEINIRSVDHKFFDEINPSWEHSYPGFARPSIEVLYNFFSAKRKKSRRE